MAVFYCGLAAAKRSPDREPRQGAKNNRNNVHTAAGPFRVRRSQCGAWLFSVALSNGGCLQSKTPGLKLSSEDASLRKRTWIWEESFKKFEEPHLQ